MYNIFGFYKFKKITNLKKKKKILDNYLKQENPKNTIMQDKPKSLTYIIQKGDLLSEIAIRFGVTVDELISQNKINPKRIYPGQKIKINI